ncbi:MAG: aldehyde dehydrogenase family protein [Pirellulales bacterium]|nr:aldehyde dehydrogenase family protein [Pirellulales bacterium]
MHLPVLRWGKPYDSLEKSTLTHFLTGEPIAQMSLANGAMLQRDMRFAKRARQLLRDFSIPDLIARLKTAGELYLNATLSVGDSQQSPEQFVKAQSGSTGLPESLARANMTKNHFVLSQMDRVLDALTRGLPLDILTRGYGVESRGVTVSYQAQCNAIGLVLPSNSPGVHTLWLPVIPLQIGLVIKPGSSEPWTPYRMFAAMTQAGIPAEAIAIYPGSNDVGPAVLSNCDRAMIFGSAKTVDQYKGNPKVQVHGPGFSKILIGDDVVDRWPEYLDLMVESVFANSGRGCINASTIWASRHTREIAAAIAAKIGPVEVKPPEDPDCKLAAFTTPGAAAAIWKMIEKDLSESGVTDLTAQYGPRLVEIERCAYLRPVVAHSSGTEANIVKSEFMFPFVTVVECPQEQMLDKIGYTLVGTAITENAAWQRELTDAVQIDRLNIGPIPTTRLDWLQPHEGNIIDFLYRARAYQMVVN